MLLIDGVYITSMYLYLEEEEKKLNSEYLMALYEHLILFYLLFQI